MESFRKSIVMLVAFGMALPLFAEIKMVRGGNGRVNMAEYWNDRKCNFNEKVLKKNMDEFIAGFQVTNLVSIQNSCTYHLGNGKFYMVSLTGFSFGGASVNVGFVNGNYREYIFKQTYDDYNAGKAKFDELCKEYYNKIQ